MHVDCDALGLYRANAPYKVTFLSGGHKVKAKVTMAGQILETEETIAPRQLPAAVRHTLESDFSQDVFAKVTRVVAENHEFYTATLVGRGAIVELRMTPAGEVVRTEHSRIMAAK